MRDDWDNIKDEVIYLVVKTKFKQNPELLPKLKNISGEIVEDNTWGDTYWGKNKGIGQNKLGRILMQVREEL